MNDLLIGVAAGVIASMLIGLFSLPFDVLTYPKCMSWLYDQVLKLYPDPYRSQFNALMKAGFLEQCEEAKNRTHILLVLIDELGDHVCGALPMRFSQLQMGAIARLRALGRESSYRMLSLVTIMIALGLLLLAMQLPKGSPVFIIASLAFLSVSWVATAFVSVAMIRVVSVVRVLSVVMVVVMVAVVLVGVSVGVVAGAVVLVGVGVGAVAVAIKCVGWLDRVVFEEELPPQRTE